MMTHPIGSGLRVGHFAGTLAQANSAPLNGIHQTALVLVDDDRAKHIVYVAHGRGDAGAASCRALHAALTVGRRYYGSATLHTAGDHYQHWAGDVTLAVDMRRAIVALPQGIEVAA